MTRINTNVSSQVAQNRLQTSNKALNSALTRLSTGLRINGGADDPAGLIASEALRSEITGLNKAISNTQRASQIISTADSALGQVSSLLNDVRGLVVEAANSGALSDEEIAANQLQIDSSLEAINRIAQSTTFQGRKLLDGSLDYTSTAGSVAAVEDINIAKANVTAGDIDVEVVVSSAATQGEITSAATGFTASAQANGSTAELSQVATLTAGTETIDVIGRPDFTSIEVLDDVTAAGTTAAFDDTTGILTVTGNFTGDALNPGEVDASTTADDIQDAIDGLDGFTATGSAEDTLVIVEPADVNSSDGAALIEITAVNAGSDYNNVAINFVAGTSNSADFDSEQKVLTINYDASGAGISLQDIADAIDAHTVDGAAAPAALFSSTAAADIEIDPETEIGDLNTGTTGGEVLNASLVFQLSGADGAETFNFGAGTSKDQIVAAVNLVSDSTGVGASTLNGALKFTSTAFGSAASVGIDVISEGSTGTFAASLDDIATAGEDISATVNGVAAAGDGNTLSINTSSLALSITTDGSGDNFSFSITGGGATFQLGPQVGSTQQANLGIGSVSTGKLGGASGRLYELGSGQAKSLSSNAAGAAKIIDEVISKITATRGRLGAFQSTTLESNLVSLNDSKANLQEAESSIRDADFAQESARLTRAQILVQSGTNVLALANQNPQNVLALLR
jgi:flagellin